MLYWREIWSYHRKNQCSILNIYVKNYTKNVLSTCVWPYRHRQNNCILLVWSESHKPTERLHFRIYWYALMSYLLFALIFWQIHVYLKQKENKLENSVLWRLCCNDWLTLIWLDVDKNMCFLLIGAIRVYQQMPESRACAVLWVAERPKTERYP